MYNWVPFPFLRITFFYLTGIISYVFLDIDLNTTMLITVVITGFTFYFFLILALQRHRFFSLNVLISTILFLLIFTFGFTRTWLSTPSNSDAHILEVKNKIHAYAAIVKKQPVEKANSHQLLVEIHSIKIENTWRKASGAVLLYIKKSSSALAANYGDKILVSGQPLPITPPKNKEEFDYREYIGFQGVYHNQFISPEAYTIISNGHGHPLLYYSYAARDWCVNLIEKHISTEREKAIALALIIGVKDLISDDISSAYASAGAMHVLAVSGLHVGVIFMILSKLLSGFKSHKYGKWAFFLIIIFALWSYAFVTGLSASVLRAVTMFSFVSAATVMKRQSNIYNTLAASAFVLLCYNPYMAMAVGYQLSFLAVFGIVYLQPKIYKWFYVQNKVLDQIWVITSVSIAAQIATAPLVVLYFHQLPSYFFISNLFVIPGAFIILCGGLLLFAVGIIPYISTIIGALLQKVIWIVNELVFLIQKIPHNTIDNIYLTTFQSWCLIAIIMFFLGLVHFRKLVWIILITLPITGYTYSQLDRMVQNAQQSEIVFYSANTRMAIDFIEPKQAYLLADSALLNNSEKLKFHIAPYRLFRGMPIDYSHINKAFEKPVLNHLEGFDLIVWRGKSIAIVHREFSATFAAKLKVDYVYLTHLNSHTFKQVKQNFNYRALVLRSFKELPDYAREDSTVHDLTTQGMLTMPLQNP